MAIFGLEFIRFSVLWRAIVRPGEKQSKLPPLGCCVCPALTPRHLSRDPFGRQSASSLHVNESLAHANPAKPMPSGGFHVLADGSRSHSLMISAHGILVLLCVLHETGRG